MVWSYKRSRGEIQTKPTLPDRFTAQTLDEAYMSHEKSGPRNYVHEKLHEQIVAKLQSELEQEREALTDCQKRLNEALVYLKRARNTMSCYDDCDSLFSEEERCNCGTENDMHEIDTFLSQIKDEGE